MQVIILANEEQRKEWEMQPADAAMVIHWLSAPTPGAGLPPADACIDLLFEPDGQRVDWLLHSGTSLIVVNSVVKSLKEIGQNFVRINGWNTFLQRDLVEASCHDKQLKEKAEALFAGFGRRTEWTPDIPGFITPRIVSSIINEAFFTLEEKVSVADEIDIAMKLGTNYPYGPFEWGQKIGLLQVYRLLEVLGKEQIRYKPSQLLMETTLV